MTKAEELLPEQVYLCRASGEGTHDFRVCPNEDEVIAFYDEMFGKDADGKLDRAVDHFRDPDNWDMAGAYSQKLYCARFEVWKVPDSSLRRALAEPATQVAVAAWEVSERGGTPHLTYHRPSEKDCAEYELSLTRLYRRPAEDARDAERLEWCLPILTGSDDKSTDMKAMQLAQALMQGLTDREAIDAARRGRP